jgi:CPA1 family monovalent cation:H+ antiporter
VKTLENAGAPKKFSSLIQGVSLFNNATSMILLLISVQFARGNYGDISNLIKYGLTLISGGILLGMGFGIITIYWVKQVNHDNALTINVTICTAYLTYFAAEYVDWGIATNGVVAVMSLGM